MATYSTIPKDEAEPLVAAAPKAASPKFKWIDNKGGQRQQIIIPGYGASSGKYTGYLDYVLTQKLCIGPPTGKLNNNKGVAVKSDQCRTKYTVKYL